MATITRLGVINELFKRGMTHLPLEYNQPRLVPNGAKLIYRVLQLGFRDRPLSGTEVLFIHPDITSALRFRTMEDGSVFVSWLVPESL